MNLAECPKCGCAKEMSRLAVPTYCVTCRNAAQTAWRERDPEGHQAARARDAALQRGLTTRSFEDLFAEQGNACAICRTMTPTGTGWHIDHDHSCCPAKSKRRCGKCYRGILCHGCNVGLGMFRDDPARLVAAARYLKGGD